MEKWFARSSAILWKPDSSFCHGMYFFFALELRDYLLGHVRSLESLDMIRKYIRKDYGVNNPHLGSVGVDRKFV